MYIALLILLFGISAFFIFRGITRRSKSAIFLGIVMATLTTAFFWWMDFYGELLWFQSVGYEKRFWKSFWFQFLFAGAGMIMGFLVVFMLLLRLPRSKRMVRLIAAGVAGIVSGIWGFANWELLLRFWFQEKTGLADPIFGMDTGFYLFTLPFLEQLLFIFLFLTILPLIVAAITGYVRMVNNNQIVFTPPISDITTRRRYEQTLYLIGSILLLILAFGKYIERYQLMFSDWGAVHGPGWTDVHIRIPALWFVTILTLIFGVLLMFRGGRNILERMLRKLRLKYQQENPSFIVIIMAGIFIIWFIALTVIPGAFQWLRVSPNEITFEKPYIENNIEFTRYGFKLNELKEQEYPATDIFTPQMVENNPFIFNNIRLWDWRALDEVYRQFQEIRLYYEFDDVDIDRYVINDTLRQVMVSARELEVNNLPQKSQTFVNKRFKYTHGYGITLTTVNEFTPNGLPNLLIKDIPPKSKYPTLEVERPEIYYGEIANDYVIVNSKEKEFNYPKGDQNVYIRYDGKGGVQLSNFWRKFLFGWKFEGTRLLVSNYPTEDSRIMFHRDILERVHNLAPFLQFDDDPYVVLSEGKLYWIIDAYTTSDYYPYSEPYNSNERIQVNTGEYDAVLAKTTQPQFHGVNYMRNSVKAVVDAYNGEVNFYIYDKDDVLVKVWDRIFPGLLKSKEALSEDLKKHIRYPIDFLLVQGLVYAKYHMDDPTVFYNQEDLWVRATEKYYNDVIPVEPYYVMWQLPDTQEPQFVLMLPFTPKNRQVLISWIAGMCDPEYYGDFISYEFPKQKRILGPQQVETKIDQDRFLSGQLTLWDQRGSNVIRGNVLAIPVENTLFYVEPIYLQAETAAYPELRLVVVMHEDNLSYGNTFEEALAGLFEKKGYEMMGEAEKISDDVEVTEAGEQVRPRITGTDAELAQRANKAFDDYIRYTGNKEFEKASRALEELQQALRQMMSSAPAADTSDSGK